MPILGYLSGAPRVSTREGAQLGAPRSHILGVIQGFEALGWGIRRYIAGDRTPESWTGKGSEAKFTSSQWKVFAADIVRLLMGWWGRRRALREVGEDVSMVYERFAALQSLGMVFRKKGIPWVLETQAPLFFEAKADRKSLVLTALAKRMEISAYQNCSYLICVTQSLKDIIVEHAGIDPDKIIVVPNGVDLRKFEPDKYSTKRLFPGFTIGFVGGLFKWQGMDYLLRAMDELVKAGRDVNLVVVGDGTMRESAEVLARQLGLESRVVFVGQVAGSVVPEYIKGFDVCFSGQIPHAFGAMYGSPMKLYEYMAMGRPVVASAFEDARNLIVHGKNGFLFQAQDHSSLVSTLELAYESRAELDAYGQLSREIVVEHHSWEARIKYMLSVIDERSPQPSS
jgi:glycosyltransferase involved in cell wall biosynthesis